MKIDRFDMIAFGHFRQKSIDFCHKKPNFHIIYGDNEAGKSTSLRALKGWLFGLKDSSDGFSLPKKTNLHLAGQLRTQKDRTIAFSRKGLSEKIFDTEEDTILPSNALADFIPSGIDETAFSQLWGISYDALVEGGEALLKTSGDVGRSLYSAALGTMNIQDILLRLEEDCDSIFKHRGRNPILNASIKSYHALKKQIKELSMDASCWHELQQRIENMDDAIKNVESDMESCRVKLASYKRIHRIQKPLARYRHLKSKLEGMKDVVLMPQTFHTDYRHSITTYHHIQSSIERDQNKLTTLQEQAAALPVSQDILMRAEDIYDLQNDVGALKKAHQDIPHLSSEKDLLEGKLHQLCETKLSLKCQDLATLRPLLSQKASLHRLIQEHHVLKDKDSEIKKEMHSLEQELQHHHSTAIHPALTHVHFAKIEAILKSIQKSGDLENTLSTLKADWEFELQNMEAELLQLGKFKRPLMGLLTAPLPSQESIHRDGKVKERIDGDIQDIIENIQDLQEQKKHQDHELKKITVRSHLPKLEQLEDSRRRRDESWTSLKECLLTKDSRKDAKTVKEKKEKVDQSIHAFEEEMTTTDVIADRLRIDAALVNQCAALELDIQDLSERIDEKKAELLKSKHELKEFHRKWQEKWKRANIDLQKASPQDMSVWLASVQRLRDRLQKSQKTKERIAATSKQHEKCLHDVHECLSILHAQEPQKDPSLSVSLTLCEGLLKHRKEQSRRLLQLEQQQKSLASSHQEMQQRLHTWHESWDKSLQGLSLDHQDSDHIMAVLEDVEAAFQIEKDRDSVQQRMNAMKQDQARYENRVYALARSLGFHVDAETDAMDLGRTMFKDLEHAKSIQHEKHRLQERMDDLKGTIEEQRRKQDQVRGVLEIWRQQAGVAHLSDLERAYKLSSEKQSLRQDLESTTEELYRSGEGRFPEQLEEEYDRSNPDSLDHDMKSVEDRLEQLRLQRDRLRDDRNTAQHDKAQMDGISQAAVASEQANACAATIESYTAQYIRLQTARLVLKHQIESFCRLHLGPVLKYASKIFSRLTLGSFDGIGDDYQGQAPVLVGLKKNGRKITVDGMSTSTRDQLFLALRLAYIEDHLSRHSPMPFIMDDILIGFDDKRTEECLKILSELATKTQVLLFTHHQRIIDISSKLFDVSHVCHHHLSSHV